MMVYLVEILIYCQAWEEHMSHIDFVLKRLRENKIDVKHSKCIFRAIEVQYLGFF